MPDPLPAVSYCKGEDPVPVIELAIAGHPIAAQGAGVHLHLWHVLDKHWRADRFKYYIRRSSAEECIILIRRNRNAPPLYDD